MSKHLHLVLGKLLYVALFVTIQVAALIVMFLFFRDQFAYFYIFCMLLSLGASIHILNNTTSNPAYKSAWLIPILLFPIFGGLLYLLFGKYRMTRKQRASSRAIRKQIATVMESEHIAADHLETLPPDAAIQARYLLRASGSPPCVHPKRNISPLERRSLMRFCGSWRQRNLSFSWSTSLSKKAPCGTAFWKCWSEKSNRAWKCG